MDYSDNRKIVHIDMDYFYAQVEELNNPGLKNMPVIIGGPSPTRGVVCTANYVARTFGVSAGQSTFEAFKKCPSLTLIYPNFDLYREVSSEIHKILKLYSIKVQLVGLDEAYLDLTDSKIFCGSATLTAREIVNEIFEKTKLTCSAGVSFNKLVAKIASDWRKPRGMFVVKPAERVEFMRGVSLRKIPGIGPVSFQMLNSFGFYTAGDVMNSSLQVLSSAFGPNKATKIYQSCYGVCHSDVEPFRLRKTFTSEVTYYESLSRNEIDRAFYDVVAMFNYKFSILDSIHFENRIISGLILKYRNEFFVTRTRTIPLSKMEALYIKSNRNFSDGFLSELLDYFDGFCDDASRIRLLGIGVRFENESDRQISINFSEL